jgi:transposase
LAYEVSIELLQQGEWTMPATYCGLDVSDKTTHLCVVDADGKVIWRGVCATDPAALAATLAKRAPDLVRVTLETGPLSAFLYHGLIERSVPAICVCARHAKGVLSTRVNKSDPHDAEGLAQLARTGWYKAVHIKDNATHMDRAQLAVREQLIKAQARPCRRRPKARHPAPQALADGHRLQVGLTTPRRPDRTSKRVISRILSRPWTSWVT